MKEQYENSIFVLSNGTGFRATARTVCEGVAEIVNGPDLSGTEIVADIYVQEGAPASQTERFLSDKLVEEKGFCPN